MQFQYYDLKKLEKGQSVLVYLQGTEANVKLMDSVNFNLYKNRHSHHYIGGHTKKSPVQLTTTHSGHWYVAIDLGGYAGQVRSRVEVLPL